MKPNELLPFLDVLIKIEGGTFITSVCWKKTSFRLLRHYNSFKT